MGPIDCPETSVRNYYYSLRNNPEELSSHLLRDRSLKSRISHSLHESVAQCVVTCFVSLSSGIMWNSYA
jgi:hypothetical protein